MAKGGVYALHSQSVQALGQQLLANVTTARELRQQQRDAGQPVTTQYPQHAKPYQTVTWKGQALRVTHGQLHLPNGRGQRDLVLPLPMRFHAARISGAALLWRADHYELALTIAEPANPPLRQDGQTAGVDQGELNAAAVVTEDGHGLVVSGRKLRSMKRQRNKRHAALQERLARCTKGSRRWKRRMRRKAQVAAQCYRQQRDVLHKAARMVVDFAQAHGVRHLAVGDVRNIQDGVNLGRTTNQKISQWAHGQLRRYLAEKAARVGITTSLVDERNTTRTCSACGYAHTRAPRGRRLRYAGCGVTMHRDGNGAANICSRAVHDVLTRVQPTHLTYRPAIERPRSSRGVVQRTPAASRNAGVAAPPSVG